MHSMMTPFGALVQNLMHHHDQDVSVYMIDSIVAFWQENQELDQAPEAELWISTGVRIVQLILSDHLKSSHWNGRRIERVALVIDEVVRFLQHSEDKVVVSPPILPSLKHLLNTLLTFVNESVVPVIDVSDILM